MPVTAGVTSFSGSATGLTPATPRTGAVALAGTLAAGSGGTGLTAPGTVGNVLTSTGSAWASSASGGGAPGGSDTQVQFNDSGAFGGDSGLTFNKTTNALTALGTITGAGLVTTTLNASGVATLASGAILATPASMTATNVTGLPLTSGVTGTLPEANGGTGTTTGYYGFKNRIINGAMVIDQRNAGASVTPASTYTLDRWTTVLSQSSKFTIQQNAASITPPAGFSYYLGATSSSAYSVLSSDYFTIVQNVEGFNWADFAWGTASASSATLSFWVRSSLTGTFGGSLRNSGATRSYPFSYTINVANTFEYKTIEIDGDTTGTWVTNEGVGVTLYFSMGSGATFSGTAGAWVGANLLSVTGATSVVGTNGATLYITGVQLEKGSTATSFDVRPYTTELQLCQRYLPAYPTTTAVTPNEELPIAGSGINSTTVYGLFEFPVPTRVPVTGVTVSSASHFTTSRPSTGNIVATAIAFRSGGSQSASINITIASGGVADIPYFLFANNASARIVFNGAEL